MRLLHLSVFASAVLCPLTAFAEEDPKFDPSQNFRPHNVTGLSALYDWTGSYYNGRTVIEVSPETVFQNSAPLCKELFKYPLYNISFPSILSITQRGRYNNGSNPFNLMLSLVPPHFDLERVPLANESGVDLVHSGLVLVLASTWPTTYWELAEGHARGPDNFHFSSSNTNTSRYTIDTMVQRTPLASTEPMQPFNITLPSCPPNYTFEEVEFKGITSKKSPVEGWNDFAFPKLTVSFDRQTADLTMTGRFSAPSFSTSDEIRGTFKLVMKRAVVDSYHSDSLIMDLVTPRWMRTVGFGNDSANVGFQDQESGSKTTKAPWGIHLILGFVAVFLVSY